jgi:hypothetical protein
MWPNLWQLNMALPFEHPSSSTTSLLLTCVFRFVYSTDAEHIQQKLQRNMMQEVMECLKCSKICQALH